MRTCLVIFAKEPEKGRVKTRLLPNLSKSECVDLYKAFLKDVINMARRIKCDTKIIAYESSRPPSFLKYIGRGFKFYKQRGRDLGERMHNAFKFVDDKESCRTMIIGSDSPDLLPCFIETGFRKLNKSDVVLGPSQDGGYYAIGLKNVCRDVFKGVKWSSSQVLTATVKNAKKLEKKTALLRGWYDIDDMKSLMYLKSILKKNKNVETAKWTREFLKI